MIAFLLSGESLEALKFFSLAWFASTPQQLAYPACHLKKKEKKNRQEMSDSISNPDLLTGWKKKRKADEKGEISPKALRGVKNLGVLAEVDLSLSFFSQACIMALTLSLLVATISSKPPC